MQSNLPIIDSHAHLDYPRIIEQLDDVIKRANEAGVKKIISIGVKLSKSKNVQAISEKYEDIFFRLEYILMKHLLKQILVI